MITFPWYLQPACRLRECENGRKTSLPFGDRYCPIRLQRGGFQAFPGVLRLAPLRHVEQSLHQIQLLRERCDFVTAAGDLDFQHFRLNLHQLADFCHGRFAQRVHDGHELCLEAESRHIV